MSVNVNRLNHRLELNGLALPSHVIKRDGSKAGFDISRIEKAVVACYGSLEEYPTVPAEAVVAAAANSIASKYGRGYPSVEQIQDLVEVTLLSVGEIEAARHYIAYRDERAKRRATQVPQEIRDTFEAERQYFPTPLQEFQYYDKYARFNWDLMRRETWIETVDRSVTYLKWLVNTEVDGIACDAVPWDRIHDAILNHRVMPSMRLLAMAGDAAKRNSLAIYSCSYIPVKDAQSFVEAMLVSMAGCGVGFSVERQHVEQFVRIARQSGDVTHHIVEDSTEGWAESLKFGLTEWFAGREVIFDYSQIRPAGTPLIIKGGRASGPGPLKFVHDFCRSRIQARQGATLRTVDAHDMMCAVGGAAVSGGVRRTAMISLFDWDDEEMRTCKHGTKLDQNPVRWNANNSAVWPDGLSQVEVVDQMMEMVRGGRGEPGIFSRSNANRNRPARRAEHEFGTNPCGEINLREFGLCNLSIAVARRGDSVVDLMEKVELATLIGTIQSLATKFPGMRDEWKQNCIDERLLGVDINGQQDCPVVQDASVQRRLKQHVIATNERWAATFNINPAASTTCNKPSGNSSLLLDCSSGIHARWAPYYIRRTRVSAATPLYRVLRDAGVPLSPENGQNAASADTWVASWPVKAPQGAITRKDRSAIEQCDYWLMCKNNWTEHNPSVTITYQPHEVLDLITWVWEHRELIGGMAFLPADDAKHEQAPHEEITAEEYAVALAAFPQIDFSLLYAYEHSDMTTAASEAACLAGACEV